MAEIENPFRWSKSRAAVFADCKRKYYLCYYVHWGGWDESAPERARLAYRLGKMTTLPALVGTAVHAALARHFQALRNGQFRKLDPERPVEMMRAAWRDAKQELWKVGPKAHPPLFEIYYDRVPPPEELRGFAEKARQSIRAIQESTRFTLDELHAAFRGCLEANAKLVTSQLDAKLVLERLLVSLLSPKKKKAA